MLAEENIKDVSLKTARKRWPSKKALESADLEKEVAKSRKLKRTAALSNALKLDDEMETGHLTRQRSKSPRSSGSKLPRLSSLPKPAKELVDKAVKAVKVPVDKEKTVNLKAEEATTLKPRAKKKKISDGKKEINNVVVPKKQISKSDLVSSQFSSGASVVKIRKSEDAANQNAAANEVALSIVVTNSIKRGSSSVQVVLPKKRWRKKPKAEGHILLNSKKIKKTAKSQREISDISESIDKKDSMAYLGAEAELEVSTKIALSTFDRNSEIENFSEASELNKLQSEMRVKTMISTYEEHTSIDQGLPTGNSSASVKHSETWELQNKVVNDWASVAQSSNTCEVGRNCNSPLVVNFGNGEVWPGTAQGLCNAVIENQDHLLETLKENAKKKEEPVEGEFVEENKKMVKKVAVKEKVDGELREGASAEPRKKRAKKSYEEDFGDESTEGVVVKETKKQEKKIDAVKIEGKGTDGGLMKEKKGVKKTVLKVGEESTEVVPIVVEKKKRIRKAVAVKVRREGAEEVPVVKTKKRRAWKPGAVKEDWETTEESSLTIKKRRANKTPKSKFGSSEIVRVDENKLKRKKGDKVATENVRNKEKKKLIEELVDKDEKEQADWTSTKENKKFVNNTDDEEINGGDIQAEANKVEEIVEQFGEAWKEEAGGGATGVLRIEKKKRDEGKGSLVKEKETEGEKVQGGCSEKKERKRKSENGEGTKRPVMCEKCGFIAGSKAALKKHDVRCHNDNEDFVRDNPFKCSICEYRAKKLSVIKRHVKKHGLEMCRFCQFVGENKILEAHVRSEHQKMTKCKKCLRRIHNDDEDYDKHVANCKGHHEYKCEICNKTFKYKSVLKVHQITHDASLPKRFSCEHCNYQSHFKANLQKHIESKHSDRQRSIPCRICEKLFFSESNLKKHLKNHTNERPHQCPHCKQSFKIAEGLKDHLATHAPADPFKCKYEDCGRTFKYRRLLKSHLVEFHNELPKKLKCSHNGCELVFFKRSHLRRHESTHSGDRNYLCTWPDCCKAFRHADNLKVHYRQHTNEKPIQCVLCGFACRQRNSLSWHMKRHHNSAESTKTEFEACQLKNGTKIRNDVALRLGLDEDEVSNHSTDSSATIEINMQADLGSLADVAQAPEWRKLALESADPYDMGQRNKEIKKNVNHEPKKPRKKKSEKGTDTVKETKPKIEQKSRKPCVQKEKVVVGPFKRGVSGAHVTDQNEGTTSSQNISECKSSCEEIIVSTNDVPVCAVAKPKRKRRTREQMAAARAEIEAEAVAKKRRRRKTDEMMTEPEPPAQPSDGVEVQQQQQGALKEDYFDLSYPYKEKRPPKGKRLLNPDKIKEVSNIGKGKVNVYDFDSGDEYRGEHLDLNFENTHINHDGVQHMHPISVTNYHDVPRQAEMMLNPATGHEVDMIEDKSFLSSRLLSNVVVALSPLDLDKMDHRELLERRENVPISETQNHDDGLKDASNIERDVRKIMEKDIGGGAAAPSDLPEEAQIFVDNEEFPDRSDGEIIDRHLLQKYLEDTSMDGFERDLMKEEEKTQVSRNQFDDYVSPETQPIKPDGCFDNYVSPDRQPMSVQPMKEGQFDNYVSPDHQPMSVQPMKAEGQFDSYMSPERQPVSAQPMKPEGQCDRYVSPEYIQVMSNRSVVNHDTRSLPSNVSQHGDSQWKGVESNKNAVIGAMDSPWIGPAEPEKQIGAVPRIFDPYATEKGSSRVLSLSEKYPNHLDSARDSSLYRIPDYGSMYDSTTRMLASGLLSYPPISGDSSHSICRSTTSLDPKDTHGYSETPTPYLQSSGLYGTNMNPPSNTYIDPRVDPYATSQLPSHASALQARDNPLNTLAISASKYIESEINKTRVYNQQGWTLQETQSLRLTHSLFPNRNNDWEASSRPSSTYSYLSDRDMAGYNACSTARPPALSERLSASYISGQTAESLEKQAFERYDMSNYLNSRRAGIPQPPSYNFDRQMTPLSSSAKAFTDSYRVASSIPDYRGLSHPATPELYTPNLNLDKYFYTRDGMYASQRVPLPSENPFLSQTSSAAQPSFSSLDYPRGSVYSPPGGYQLMDNNKYSDSGRFAQPISSMQGREFYLPTPGSTGHIQDPYRPPMLYNMMNRYFE